MSYRLRGSSIQRVGEGQKSDKFRCVFQDLPQNLPTGVPEQPFCQLGVQKCPKVMPNGYQNPSTIVQKWSLESTWYPLASQILPRGAQELKKVPKVIKNLRFLGSYCSCFWTSLLAMVSETFWGIFGKVLLEIFGSCFGSVLGHSIR